MNELLRNVLFLPEQRSTIARDIDALHYFVILTTMAGATAVAALAGAFIIRYRHRRGEERRSRPFVMPGRIEVPLFVGLFVLFIVWWVIGMRQYVRLQVPPEEAMELYVTGKQWMWSFTYPDGQTTLATLYVPQGQPVRLIMTSRDVIHSFYVPDFRVKHDVVPGRYTSVWFEATDPGTYEILCTEYCGAGHSTMRGAVVALAPADWAAFIAGRLPAEVGPAVLEPHVVFQDTRTEPEPLLERGRRAAAEYGCLRCHTLDGTRYVGPTWSGLYGSTVLLRGGRRARVDEAYITESMMDPQVKVHEGFAPVMPSYQGFIGPAETAAIVELIKALRDRPPVDHATPAPPLEAAPPVPSAPPGQAPFPPPVTGPAPLEEPAP